MVRGWYMDIQDILGAGGRIANRLDHYEVRAGQLGMAEAVAGAIANEEPLMVEAGTGIGKSFAYLVPAILAISQNQNPPEPQVDPEDASETHPDPSESLKRMRVVISTHTIALQEQLVQKDIPFLRSVLPFEFTAVLVKGRRNYLCRRRLVSAMERAEILFTRDRELEELDRIQRWAQSTEDGSLSDLGGQRPPETVWDEVSCDSLHCRGRACRYHQDCFFKQARNRARRAQILVVNHSLLFSDLALREEDGELLPPYQILVLDEAHTIGDVAAGHFGISISSGQIDYLLNRLYNGRTQRGILSGIFRANTPFGRELSESLERCRGASESFFSDIRHWLESRESPNGRVRQAELFGPELCQWLEIVADQTDAHLDEIAEAQRQVTPRKAIQMELFRNLRTKSSDLTSGDERDEEHYELTAAVENLRSFAIGISHWRTQAIPDAAYWVEDVRGRFRRRMVLNAAPVNVGERLRTAMFQRIPTVILTSATLSTGRGSFAFIQNQLGLTQCRSMSFDSPFDYRRQARLILAKDVPDPVASSSAYEPVVSERIRGYLDAYGDEGGTFVLFTSYDLMHRVAERLTPWATEQGFAIFNQADGEQRMRLLDRFRRTPRAVLFGADTFWQGVDVPGNALRTVIITKLPFTPPDQPLTEARIEAIRSSGGNPFAEYQVPLAVIRLKQGFGRLIRSREDQGTVIILDPRIRTRNYGQRFLDALPDCEITVE
ncbi:MAG: helicase C-terminal domain-containing protein [Planctomycetia bacterium]|nr:helicase C-terminal domain-containing protein [Planctomycetia bacterium]